MIFLYSIGRNEWHHKRWDGLEQNGYNFVFIRHFFTFIHVSSILKMIIQILAILIFFGDDFDKFIHFSVERILHKSVEVNAIYSQRIPMTEFGEFVLMFASLTDNDTKLYSSKIALEMNAICKFQWVILGAHILHLI